MRNVNTPKRKCVAYVLWRVLFIVPLRYLFAIGFRCMWNKHQYLAFDVSLPPPNYLSCSPKQLDSGSTFTNYVMCSAFYFNACEHLLLRGYFIHKTWLSHSMAVVKLQKLLSSAKRCVFETMKWLRKEKSCIYILCACVKYIYIYCSAIQLECFRCYNSFQTKYRSTTPKNGLYRRAELRTSKENCSTYALLPTSFAITKGILVSFYYCAALTDMFKFSAYPHSSWCALKKWNVRKFIYRFRNIRVT